MTLCYRRLIDDDQLLRQEFSCGAALCQPERRLPKSRDQRGAIFFIPDQSPILSFSACLAENPGWLTTGGTKRA